MKTPNLDVEPFVEALRGDLPSRGDEERVRSRLLAAGILVTGAAATSNAAASLGGSGLGSGAASPLAATASPFAAGAGAGTLATTSGAGVLAASAVASGAVASGAVASGAVASGAGVAGGLGAAGAPAALAKAGLLSKVLLLPMAAKLGVATTLAVAVASSVPLVVSQGDSAPPPHHTASPARQARAAEATPSESGGASPPRASAPSGDSPVSPREVLQASDRGRAPSPGATAAKRRESIVSARRSAGTTLSEPQPAASGTTPAPTARAAAFSGREHTANAASPERGRTERVRVSTLGEETRLMEQAMLALGEGDRDLAQRSLDEHARRFPRGLLMPERERARERLRQLDADRR